MNIIYNKTLEFLHEFGLTLTEYLSCIGNETKEMLYFPDEDQKNFNQLYNVLKSHENKTNKLFHTTKNKGDALEELVNRMFVYGGNPLLTITQNVRTSTNEIDLLIDWTDFARAIGFNNYYSELSNGFLCECKYYNKKVSVTYIGKFYSLLKSSNTKIGLFFTWSGVTGRSNWSDSIGLIKKIALKDEIYIIDFDQKDYDLISQGKKNVFSLIHDKYLCLKNDIDFSNYITAHENEDKLKKLCNRQTFPRL